MTQPNTQLVTLPMLISVPPEALPVNPEWLKAKADLLARVAKITAVTDAKSRDIAINAAASVKARMSAAEDARKKEKDPYYKTGKAIDSTVAEYNADLEIQLRRLNGMVGQYETNRRAEEERERQRQVAEAKRLEDARLLKLKEEQEASERAAASEKNKLAPENKAAHLEAALDAQDAQDKIEAEQRKLDQQRIDAAEENRKNAASGGMLRYEYDIDITNLHELYKARPDCVKLTPDLVQIKYLINNSPSIELPGVTYVKRAMFAARKGAQR